MHTFRHIARLGAALLLVGGGTAACSGLATEPTPAPIAARPGEEGITRGPYLQDVTPDGATVVWHTAAPVQYSLAVRPDAGATKLVPELTAGTEHLLRARSLQPNTLYHYSLTAHDGLPGPEYTLRTAPPPGAADPFTFNVWGDSGCACPPQMDVAAQMARTTPALLLHTGDMIYETGEANLFDPRFFAPYHDLLARSPVYPVLGNHDMGTDSGGPWLQAFFLPGDRGDHSTRYYAFTYGNAHFIALDSEQAFGPTSAQYNWLLADLQSPAAQSATWRFAYFHRPPYSSGKGHGSSYDIRETWGPLFERFGVDIVFNGHEHNYERSTPRRDYAAVGGTHAVVYVVTGGGGKQLYDVGRQEWTAESAMVSHFVQVQLDGSRLHLEAIDATGKVFDQLDLSH